jgi:hypothetical protein
VLGKVAAAGFCSVAGITFAIAFSSGGLMRCRPQQDDASSSWRTALQWQDEATSAAHAYSSYLAHVGWFDAAHSANAHIAYMWSFLCSACAMEWLSACRSLINRHLTDAWQQL